MADVLLMDMLFNVDLSKIPRNIKCEVIIENLWISEQFGLSDKVI